MRQPKFEPAPLEGDPRFVRDRVSGLVYNRAASRVLYADTDRSNIVYHANYLRYFEYGRANLMRDVGFPYAQVEASGFVYPIFDLGVQYFQPLRYDDPFLVHTRTGDIDRVRIRFDYVITHAESGCLVCRGHTRHCALNPRGQVVAVDPITVATWQNFPK
ncbi:MAG TPA: thioesterase family protein [Myxococcota bacterium]|nr:thioesterase family protein [Myxococcota bacterium]HRY92841.1 thioesterase family protein [Myxococcota bacterium]HSA20286.1 thioesterase family protein [Myxococcota bacterium]